MRFTSQTSWRRAQAQARAPKVALLAVCAVLSAAGLRSVFAPPAPPLVPAPARVAAPADDEAIALAHAFARAYLSRGKRGGEDALRALAPSLLDELESHTGTRRRVKWSTVVRSERVPGGVRVVVLAETVEGFVSLAVPVSRDVHGALAVTDLPAIVGQPAAGAQTELPDGSPTESPVASTVTRALRNFLRGDGDALSADLVPGAVVALPDEPLSVREVDEVTWIAGKREVRVLLTARAHEGADLRLAYRVGVARQAGRWFVNWIGTQQPSGGRSR